MAPSILTISTTGAASTLSAVPSLSRTQRKAVKSMKANHHRYVAEWKKSACLHDMAKKLDQMAATHVHIINAICISPGSFDPSPRPSDNGNTQDRLRTSHVRLYAFLKIVQRLERQMGRVIECHYYYYDKTLSGTDEAFLASLGPQHHVVAGRRGLRAFHEQKTHINTLAFGLDMTRDEVHGFLGRGMSWPGMYIGGSWDRFGVGRAGAASDEGERARQWEFDTAAEAVRNGTFSRLALSGERHGADRGRGGQPRIFEDAVLLWRYLDPWLPRTKPKRNPSASLCKARVSVQVSRIKERIHGRKPAPAPAPAPARVLAAA